MKMLEISSEPLSRPGIAVTKNANSTSLPQEVLDLIIDEINTPPEDQNVFLEHQRTLRAFLFVSSVFRTRALSILFRQLAVSAHNQISFDRIQALADILGSALGSAFDSPGRHVQEITISFLTGFELSDSDDNDYDYHSMTPYEYHHSMTPIRDVMAKQCVIDLLKTLHSNAPNLCVFFLHIRPEEQVDWTTLDIRFQNALHALIRSRSLIQLQITHISRLPSTFIRGAHIKVLQVYQLLRDSEPSFSPPNPADANLPDPPLEIFITDHTYPFGTDTEFSPQGSTLLARLRILVTFIGSKEEAAKTWQILAASPQLVTLQIAHMGEIEGPPSTFNLGQLQNLKEFSLTHNRTDLMPYVPANDRSLAWLYALLDVSSPMKAFEQLEIKFRFQEYNVQTNFFYPVARPDFSQWDQLDKLLSGPKYPSLQQVSLAFRVRVRVPPESEDFDNQAFEETTIRKLRDEFPRLRALKRVFFKLTLKLRVDVAMSIEVTDD